MVLSVGTNIVLRKGKRPSSALRAASPTEKVDKEPSSALRAASPTEKVDEEPSSSLRAASPTEKVEETPSSALRACITREKCNILRAVLACWILRAGPGNMLGFTV
jgi:hypothetical protein